MQVKIEVTLDVNREKWANEFGLDKADVVTDVKNYFAGTCQEQLAVLGLGDVDPSLGSVA